MKKNNLPQNYLLDIVNKTCDVYNVHINDLFGKTKTYDIVEARHMLCYIAFSQNILIKSEISKLLNRDHSTIIHAIKKVDHLLKYDKNIKEKYSLILK